MTPANMATSPAPSTPPAMPMVIQRPRPGTPRVAAITMPTISPASRTSRKTMRSAPSIILFRDERAFCRGLVKLAKERITARLERPNPHHALRFAGDELLDVHLFALKFLRRCGIVDHCDLHPFVRRHFDLGRRKTVILDGQYIFLRMGVCSPQDEEASQPNQK